MERFCYLGDTIGAISGADFSGITRIRSEWKKFSDLVSLLGNGGLPLGANGKLYSMCTQCYAIWNLDFSSERGMTQA